MSTPRARAPRTLTQKLGSIVLGFESIVVFLAGLTVFGLKALPEGIPPWWGIVGGSVLAIAMIALAGAIARPGAIVVGWVLQALVLAAAFLVPAIALVALIFGGMWAYATIVGARVDRRSPTDTPIEPHTESE
ncbi:DUF4233 domain-containing protein [Microbacterium sp. W4I4]|uniref:DUF4233 domain-containing protein n=1 Tax=Microbacterium sp. W4I4 TaxID=3042295 RepID=UPI0027D82628|nr:DUF4233 domain-containing protein [Microbacterium sp. W4I4]